MLLHEYKLALKSFKRMLQVAWHVQNDEAEIVAYAEICRAYFYLGQVDKS